MVRLIAACFTMVFFSSTLTPAAMAKNDYDIEKPKKKKGEQNPKLFEPNDKFTDFKANWTHSLTGLAANSLGEADWVNRTESAPLSGSGASKPKDTVKVTWANGDMHAEAQFVDAGLLPNPDGTYTAWVRVYGNTKANVNNGRDRDWAYAFASSTSKLEVSGQAKGGGKWIVVPDGVLSVGNCSSRGAAPPAIGDLGIPPEIVAAAKAGCKAFDPISFEALNLESGETAAGNLISWDLEALSDGGTLGFDDGALIVGTASGTLFLDIPGLYTLEQGLIDFAFEEGVVTRSITSGMFAGLLPAVGSAASGRFELGIESLTYDFGWSEALYDVRFDVGTGGSSVAYQIVPEPGVWAMLIAGFGAVGVSLRRRRNLTLPLRH